jgi:hypothetical protein
LAFGLDLHEISKRERLLSLGGDGLAEVGVLTLGLGADGGSELGGSRFSLR